MWTDGQTDKVAAWEQMGHQEVLKGPFPPQESAKGEFTHKYCTSQHATQMEPGYTQAVVKEGSVPVCVCDPPSPFSILSVIK